MNQLTTEQRVFIVERYHASHSSTQVKRSFAAEYHRNIDYKTVKRVVDKWKAHGTIRKLNKEHSGRPINARSEGNIASVQLKIANSSCSSVRKLAAQVDISRESIRRILRKNLKLTPYKMQTSQTLTHDDNVRRLHFCQRINQATEQGTLNVNTIVFSDESHIYLDGFVNKQTCRYWSSERPVPVIQKPLHSRKVTVWCGVSANRIYGPYFFEDANSGNARTVTSEAYIEMLSNVMNVDISPDVWFQQDGATSHTSLPALEWLKTRFGDKIISHRTEFPWPARSPDLSPLDFFLWRFVKQKIFKSNPKPIPALKKLIQEMLELKLKQNSEVKRQLPQLQQDVLDQKITPYNAAQHIIKLL